MANRFDPIELGSFLETLKAYERVSGLTHHRISLDESSMWIDWGYTDGLWAGTTSFDLPLAKAIEKLERDLHYEHEMLRVGQPKLTIRYAEIDVEMLEMAS